MRNRPLPSYHPKSTGPTKSEDPEIGWNLRLFILFGLLAAVLATILGRLAYIQLVLPDSYVRSFNFTRTEREIIPGRDGRILTDTGVLATDVVRYDVEAHYRWLERPANHGWLRHRASNELTRQQRRDSKLVNQAQQRVVATRDRMWSRLLEIADLQPKPLADRCRSIQSRVERIAGSVNRRREQRRLQAEQRPPREPGVAGWLRQARDEITSPPSRGSLAPIVVQEELGYHAIATNVSVEVAAEIQAHPELYPGLRIKETTSRHYPQNDIAAHLIGVRARVADSDDPHRVGRSGVERSYDGRLRGIDGERVVTYNRRGEVVNSRVVREPVRGEDVVLTVDLRLQRSAESLLDSSISSRSAAATDDVTAPPAPPGGCVVVVDVSSGEVVAMANAPRYDLNLLTNANSKEWQATVDDPRHPLFPRATQMMVPPGSVFKVLTAVAMLEGSDIDPRTNTFCNGFLHRPDRHRCAIFRNHGIGHGEINLQGALARSCNVYFFEAAQHMGAEPLILWARRFGFGLPTGIDLPFERAGNLPVPPKSDEKNMAKWYPGDTLGLAIGQSRLTVTPLQIARMMAAIANGGYLIRPRTVDQAGNGDATPANDWNRTGRDRIPALSARAITAIRKGLFDAVQEPGGTGYRTVRLNSVAIAGKTGTAETGRTRDDHAWFAGYVPANRPQYAFVVVLQHGGSGGDAAGPLARKLVEAMLSHELLEADRLSSAL